MMNILGGAMGTDKIYGEKFPFSDYVDDPNRTDAENSRYKAVQSYVVDVLSPDHKEDEKRIRDMNPNGYWECRYTTTGIQYRSYDDAYLKGVLSREAKKTICKIVSQGLALSDPSYIGRIIYMVRHPQNVAKSQERLKKSLMARGKDGSIFNALSGIVVYSPEMFIQVTLDASRWLQVNKQIPVLFVDYEKLVSDPRQTLKSVGDFLGQKSICDMASMIDANLARSESHSVEGGNWAIAEQMHHMLQQGDTDGIVRGIDKAKLDGMSNWYCPRSGQTVSSIQCKSCSTNESTRREFRLQAVKRGIDWKVQPCLYEVAFDNSREIYISIEESIKHNFWLDEGDVARISPCVHRSKGAVEKRQCKSCQGNVRVHVYPCSVHGKCVVSKQIDEMARCDTCSDYKGET